MNELALKVVDGVKLDEERRALLRPGDTVHDARGRARVLPRFFYEIDSWDQAKRTFLSPHFRLSELISVDCREAALLLETFPHYVPCAISILSRYLEAFRQKADAPVFVSANGGYRSPAHALSQVASPHLWATAANVYRVGDTFLDDPASIEKYGRMAEGVAPEIFAKPYGHGEHETDDHVHLDIGYVTYVPHQAEDAA
ncbi:MAG TPA: hypothetical protein VGO90_09865 [Chthoniobacteraceae bacterium]|jgi:hypothetical protein|nr:Peptidase [Chthoniobacter sp.]HEV7867977.1 hypothetical protein [Chthoniobacteraceae bacterium]